jgi:hypothetical protein
MKHSFEKSNTCKHDSRNESGSSLILALVYVVAISLVVLALASWASNDLSNSTAFSNASQFNSALRSVTELGIQNIRYYPLDHEAIPGPGYCWQPAVNGMSSETVNGYSVAVWCSTVQDLTKGAYTRIVTFDACLISVGVACVNKPSLQAQVGFDDYLQGGSAYSPVTCTATCGQSATTLYWSFRGASGGVPTPSSTTTLPGVTTTTSSPTTTTSTPTTSTSTTSTTSTTTTSTTTTTVVGGNQLSIVSSPQTFETQVNNGSTTSGSVIIQSQNGSGAPLIPSSPVTVTINVTNSSGLPVTMNGGNSATTVTIPTTRNWAAVTFSVNTNPGNPTSFTVSATATSYSSANNVSESVQTDASSSSTTIGSIASATVTNASPTVTFNVPVSSSSSSTRSYRVTSVGGLLPGESVGGAGITGCLALTNASGTLPVTVTVNAQSTRFLSNITPTTLDFLVTRFSDNACQTPSSTNQYQGDATLYKG